jgi:hypothetical protein
MRRKIDVRLLDFFEIFRTIRGASHSLFSRQFVRSSDLLQNDGTL